MARRTLSQLAVEAQTRLGLAGSVPGLTRVQSWLTATYFFMATAERHPELEDFEPWDVAASASSEPFTAGTRIVYGIRLADAAGNPLHGLDEMPIREVLSNFNIAEIRPKVYAIHGREIYFQAPTDAIYKLQVARSRLPIAPDYTGSATSELGEELDERLIEGAVALGRSALGIPEAPDAAAQSLAMADATVTGSKSGRSRPNPQAPQSDANNRGVR